MSAGWQIKPANVVTKEEQKTIDAFASKYRSTKATNSTFAQLTTPPPVYCHILYRERKSRDLVPCAIVYIRPSKFGNHVIAADAKAATVDSLNTSAANLDAFDPLKVKLKEILATRGHFIVIPKGESSLVSLINELKPTPNDIPTRNVKYADIANEHGQGDALPLIYGIPNGTFGGGKRRSRSKANGKSKSKSKSKTRGKSKTRSKSRSKAGSKSKSSTRRK